MEEKLERSLRKLLAEWSFHLLRRLPISQLNSFEAKLSPLRSHWRCHRTFLKV